MSGRVLRSWAKALRDFFHPKIILLSLVCFFVAMSVFVLLLFFFGGPVIGWLSSLTQWSFDGFWGYALLVIVTFPLFLILGILLLSIFALPWVRRIMRGQGLAARPNRGGLSLGREIGEAVLVSFVGVAAWVLSLLLFWIPVVPFLLSYGTLAWVQWRLLALDVWGETEDPASFRRLVKSNEREGFLLSLGLTWLAAVPLVNFYFPVFSALAFLHWDQELQREKI